MNEEALFSGNFEVEGMHCANCGKLVDEALEELRGVQSASTGVRQGVTVVEFDPAVASPKTIVKAIRKVGYTAKPA